MPRLVLGFGPIHRARRSALLDSWGSLFAIPRPDAQGQEVGSGHTSVGMDREKLLAAMR